MSLTYLYYMSWPSNKHRFGENNQILLIFLVKAPIALALVQLYNGSYE